VVLNRLALSETVRRLGLPGVAGITLVVFSLSYALSALLPLRQEVAGYQAQIAAAQQRAARGQAGLPDDTPAGQLRAFFQYLPPQPNAAEWLDKVYLAADKERVTLLRGEYALALDPETGIARYRILLPVKGSYGQVRGFISAALDSVPSLALDDVNFERDKISESQVDARVRMTLYLKGV
jgi:hypothetical protein